MSEHLSSASQDKKPTLLIGEDGTLIEANSEETDAHRKQQIGRTELGFEDFDPYHDRDSARMTAAAKLEEALLDLDERGAGADEKAEVEAALATVATIEPNKEAGLSRIGVATKEVERLERYVKAFEESGDKRLSDAVARLNSARLVVDVLTAAEDEQSAINNQVTAEAEDYDVAQVQARAKMADSHNGLIRRNRHRRNNLNNAA
mgnify:CR=1 FL=1